MITLLQTLAARAEVDPRALKQTIGERLGVPVYLVEQTPIRGLYLLGTAKGPLYSDAKGDYVLQGAMLDLSQDMKNLAVLGLRDQRRVAMAQIDEPRILLRAPAERHRITLLTGLACHNCLQVVAQLPQLQASGISVQVLPIMTGQGDTLPAEECEAEPLRQLNASEYLPASRCSEILAHYVGLSQWLGIKALPSWVLPNGDLVSGYQSAEQLLKILEHTDAPANPSPSTS